jgi:hypothetical protein
MLFLHRLFYEEKETLIQRRGEKVYRNSSLSCSGIPNISRQRGHLIVFSPIET